MFPEAYRSDHLDVTVKKRWRHRIFGITCEGDLLFSSFGNSTQQRTVAKYSPQRGWLRDYTHVDLQPVQGTPAGTPEAVFVASRFLSEGRWTGRILVFCEDGTDMGRFGKGNERAN